MASSSDPPPASTSFWKPSTDPTPRLQAIERRLGSGLAPRLRISRVAQLDADLLDHELESILAAPMGKALQGLRLPGGASWEPELMALLRIAVLKMSIYDRGITYGSGLQNLKYRNERGRATNQSSAAIDVDLTRFQKLSYMALLVLPSYLHSRLRDRMLLSSWSDEPLPSSWFSFFNPIRILNVLVRPSKDSSLRWRMEVKRVCWELLNLVERCTAMATLANFLIFLYDGRYRTLVDRILGMRLIYAQRSIKPNVSFEFLNRQLVWEAFTEFLLFLMPLISVRRLRTRILRTLSNWTLRSKLLSMLISNLPQTILRTLKIDTQLNPNSYPLSNQGTKGKPSQPQGPYAFLPSTTCPICYSTQNAPPTRLPTNPTNFESDRSGGPSSILGSDSNLGASTNPSGSASLINGDVGVKVPYVANCGWGCRYCYYCVVEKLVGAQEEGEEGWGCWRCGAVVTEVWREVGGKAVVEGEAEEKGGEGDEGGKDLVVGDGESVLDEKDSIETQSVGSEHNRWRDEA
ncbi:BZ3500_MvSof-1268-A1-R1_Chr2-2g04823 [Microbotryum saponariae]|uniref:RING-type E3 ubiquitin transferase (cysteine targeting) n=1 Tax=Microbotryum saponariae TaxID=289078 RepID=A0A2X0N4V3_9BASI|nr:BZ3500_MvSof-1268-A1-R1_Chr2-2g04823 [Microbotryum saponariae]SDA00256.1 BZ3501_MvSof-1269-A2-R1_Chr2-2g04497 [Microbotryum saponariae]